MAATHPLAIDPGDIFHQRQQRDMMRSGRNGAVLVGNKRECAFRVLAWCGTNQSRLRFQTQRNGYAGKIDFSGVSLVEQIWASHTLAKKDGATRHVQSEELVCFYDDESLPPRRFERIIIDG